MKSIRTLALVSALFASWAMCLNAQTISIAEARAMPEGATVTVKGIVTCGGEFNNSLRYLQDGTGGIALFHSTLSGVGRGDSLEITGQLTQFNNLLEIVQDGGTFNFSVINSGNDLPEPINLSIADGFAEAYEGRLVRFDGVFFDPAGGAFLGNSNYTLSDGTNTGIVRIDGDTNIPAVAIPEGEGSIVGIISQYQSDYQLMPRDTVDLEWELVNPPAPEEVSIAEARLLPLGTTVTLRGLVTNGPELGNIRYMQDETAGIAIYDPASQSGAASVESNVTEGDSLLITGQLTEFFGLLEMKDEGGLFEFEVLNGGNPLPQPVFLDAADGFAEEYEGQLVHIRELSFGIAGGGVFNGNTTYDVVDAAQNGYDVRVNNGAETITDELIPTGVVDIVGVMSETSAGYQLLPRYYSDIIPVGSGPIVTGLLVQDNLGQSGFSVGFSTFNEGDATVYYGLTPGLELGSVSDAGMGNTHQLDISGLQPGTIYYVQAESTDADGETSTSGIQAMATVSESTGDIKVYFNHSVNHSVSTGVDAVYLHNTFIDTLLAYIGRAQETIDMTFYSLDNDDGIVDALVDAYNSGVETRFVCNESIDDALFAQLPGTDKIKRPEALDGIMHNKFMIIDANSANPNAPIVWTGSTNYNHSQLFDDANNIIIVQDQSLARSYELEFEEMLGGDFAGNKTNNTPTEFLVGGKRVQAYFSPTSPMNTIIREAINASEDELFFGLLSFTRIDIASELVDLYEQGVTVAGILEGCDNATVCDILENGLGDQFILEDESFIFHHKYMISDPNLTTSDPFVLTGSHNWTNSAQVRNDENTLIVHDAAIANQYYQEWVARYVELGGQLPVFVGNRPTPDAGLRYYPNPANGLLVVEYNAPSGSVQAGKLGVSLTDMMGKTVFGRSFSPSQSQKYMLALPKLPTGVYILDVNGERGRLFVR